MNFFKPLSEFSVLKILFITGFATNQIGTRKIKENINGKTLEKLKSNVKRSDENHIILCVKIRNETVKHIVHHFWISNFWIQIEDTIIGIHNKLKKPIKIDESNG